MQWLILLILLVSLSVIAYQLLRAKRRRDSNASLQKNPYHCVSVEHGLYACATVRRMAETRYLSKDAPPLPLPTCGGNRRCQCRYVHFDDRRVEERRTTFGRSAAHPSSDDRRSRDRRRVPHHYAV